MGHTFLQRNCAPLVFGRHRLPGGRAPPPAPFEPSWAEFDGDGNLLAWSESAAEHWLFLQRDGRSDPVEAAL